MNAEDDEVDVIVAPDDLVTVDVLVIVVVADTDDVDDVVDAVEESGELLFHGVSIRPGKPGGCGLVNDTVVFTLSGQPVAAMAQFDIFARGYLIKMQGLDYNYKMRRID